MAAHFNRRFGTLLRRERERSGISLRQFATRIGVSATYLSKIERGELPPPAADKIMAIARALGMPPDRFVTLARTFPPDLQPLVRQNPEGMIALLRETAAFPDEALFGLLRAALAIASAYEKDAPRG